MDNVSMVSSPDGYCTSVTFDEILPAHHVQQHTIQLQSIANHHSVPLAYSTSSSSSVSMPMMMTPMATPASGTVGLPALQMPPAVVQGQGGVSGQKGSRKRNEPPLTPAASVDGGGSGEYFSTGDGEGHGDALEEKERDEEKEPPKKKRRVVLTRVGDLGS